MHTLNIFAWLTRRIIGALFVIPGVTILLNATNELHHLYYASIGIDTSGPFPLATLQPGPWYWVQVSYSLLVTLLGSWLILWMWQQTPRVYRSQLSIIMVGACFPLGINIIYLIGIRPLGHIDLVRPAWAYGWHSHCAAR
ncbi:MAG: histidine kinase N-terminal 7TM domain-containing protein [Roseiflexaceae bacterium]|nr:histidine kinase N-terminal 7TM domain-containing protein [Roseiflexaceae bacterium]